MAEDIARMGPMILAGLVAGWLAAAPVILVQRAFWRSPRTAA